uniref:THAP-type domain-containing protein n=1 Tax=Myripristis murdjan TaxID=586833 RepID=A0A667XU29_9TELE
MPQHCAAYDCKNRRTAQSRQQGITFHRCPKEQNLRKKWEVALRRKHFRAMDESVLCCEHFKPEDFNRTVGLRSDVIPSVFNFPAHLQTAGVSFRLFVFCISNMLMTIIICVPATNILILMVLAVGCIDEIKNDDNVITLEQEKSNARKRELRAKSHMKDVLQEWRCRRTSVYWDSSVRRPVYLCMSVK